MSARAWVGAIAGLRSLPPDGSLGKAVTLVGPRPTSAVGAGALSTVGTLLRASLLTEV
jgi:hypothetical protein